MENATETGRARVKPLREANPGRGVSAWVEAATLCQDITDELLYHPPLLVITPEQAQARLLSCSRRLRSAATLAGKSQLRRHEALSVLIFDVAVRLIALTASIRAEPRNAQRTATPEETEGQQSTLPAQTAFPTPLDHTLANITPPAPK